MRDVEQEIFVTADLGEFSIRGYVDRVERHPDGSLVITDYKTGKAPGAGYEQKALFQMRFYALVLWRATGRVPRLLQLMYLGSGHILRYEPDADDLRATLAAKYAAERRQFGALRLADQIEAEGGGGGRHGADAEDGEVEALGAAEDVAKPAALDQRLARRRPARLGAPTPSSAWAKSSDRGAWQRYRGGMWRLHRRDNGLAADGAAISHN